MFSMVMHLMSTGHILVSIQVTGGTAPADNTSHPSANLCFQIGAAPAENGSHSVPANKLEDRA